MIWVPSATLYRLQAATHEHLSGTAMRWPVYPPARAGVAAGKHGSVATAGLVADVRLSHHAGARELQQVVRSGSQTGQVYGAQSTPVTTLNGGNGGGNSGNSGSAAGPSSGNGKRPIPVPHPIWHGRNRSLHCPFMSGNAHTSSCSKGSSGHPQKVLSRCNGLLSRLCPEYFRQGAMHITNCTKFPLQQAHKCFMCVRLGYSAKYPMTVLAHRIPGWMSSALTCGLCMTDDSGSGNGNASNNAAGRTPATLIRKDLGSSNSYIGG